MFLIVDWYIPHKRFVLGLESICMKHTETYSYANVEVKRNMNVLSKFADLNFELSTSYDFLMEDTIVKIIFLPRKCQKLEIRLIQNGQKFQMVKITISHPKYLLFRSKAFQEYKNFQKILISRYCYLHLKF